MITTTSLRRVPATAGAGSRVAVVVFAVLAAGWWSFSGPAGAAVLAFALAPTSGPPGTHVAVSGTGCSPGLTLSASDFVAVAAPTFGVTVQRPVEADGSWHGTFKVPADAVAGDAAVAAVCVTDGLPSLTTLYTPQVFTVTTASATTTTSQPPPTTTGGTTPTTTGGTTPKPGGGSTPTTPGGPPPDTGGGSEPSTTVPTSDGVPSGGPNGGPGGGEAGNKSGAGARPVKADVDRAPRRATPMGRAADLRAPELSAARINDMSELDWLAWTLLIALVVAAVAAPLVLRRIRSRDTGTPTTGDVA
jgi:hypothetical protein